MKLLKSIKLLGGALILTTGVLMTSCDFLDIVPPEQADMDDAVKDATETEEFLYTCYANVTNPITYTNIEFSTDEFATPQAWGGTVQNIAYDLLIPASEAPQNWNYCYKYIGQTLLFLEYLPKAKGITAQQRSEYEAEAYFLLAYYHFQILRLYGPCPITDNRIDVETPAEQYNGRFHYDAVTNWIVDILDNKVIKGYNLPTERTETTRGRATHAIACALKARVLLYAASPLWNGEFPYKDWRNKVNSSYGGVDYGTELVSSTYDPQKWERARVACEEALEEAQIAGHKLYEDLGMYSNQSISLDNIYIPGGATEDFKKRVMMLRYLVTTRHSEGNTEFIWGVSKDDDYTPSHCMMPWRVLKKNNDTWVDGYNSYAPFLNAMESFYTKDGKFLDTAQPDLLSRANVDEARPDIIKLAVNREPRFYAWMAFDQGDWGTMIADGKPVQLEMKDSQKQGMNPELHYRDRSETGFLAQKFVRPNRRYDKNGNVTNDRFQRPLIRMAELYLNLAECYAAQGNTTKALANLNRVHERAGLSAITESDITTEYPLMKWIQNERFIELYGEGHRYYDLRRWMIAPEFLSSGKREGLNAVEVIDPTFAQFNQRVKVNQPYRWSTRMYLLPIIQSEIGKNTNLVQAPGY